MPDSMGRTMLLFDTYYELQEAFHVLSNKVSQDGTKIYRSHGMESIEFTDGVKLLFRVRTRKAVTPVNHFHHDSELGCPYTCSMPNHNHPAIPQAAPAPTSGHNW